jgi:hypothetical protein
VQSPKVRGGRVWRFAVWLVPELTASCYKRSIQNLLVNFRRLAAQLPFFPVDCVI